MTRFRLTIISAALSFQVWALPQGANVVQGSASLSETKFQLQIHQATDFLQLNFDSFNVAANETVNFVQPSGQSIVVNHVLSADPTELAGRVSANGQMVILAPGGLIIHEGSTLEAGSLMASTLSPLLIYEHQLKLINVNSGAGIVNHGVIRVGQGYLELLGNNIYNDGSINNLAGDVNLHLADAALVRFNNDVIAIEVKQSALDGVVKNMGQITAVGGDVNIHATVRNQIHELVVQNNGQINAQSVWQEGGDIYIGVNEGDIENSGVINSLSLDDNAHGSHILIEGERIANMGSINAQAKGFGNGGDVQLLAMDAVVLTQKSSINVNANLGGNGGLVKVFSPNFALFSEGANIDAQAGFNFGNGGYVDVSGWQWVEANGSVNTLATNGENGTFLIDPYDILINTSATNNVTIVPGPTMYSPNNTGANIQIANLESNLQSGDVTIRTSGGGGVESGDITLQTSLNLDGTHGNILRLEADGSILINGHVLDQNTASVDTTNIVLQAGGGISVADGVVMNSGGGTMSMSAGGNISISNINTGGGDLFLIAGGELQDAGDGGFGYDIDAGGGQVNFNVSGNIGGSSWASALEINNSVLDFTVNSANRNIYIDGGLSTQDITIANLDYDGGDGLSFNIRNGNGGDILVNGILDDSNLGSADSASFYFNTTSVNGDIVFNSGSQTHSRGDGIAIFALGDITLAEVRSYGAGISVTANNIHDGNTVNSDLNSGGGLITLNARGNIGGTSFLSAIEIVDSIVDIEPAGTNQNIYISNSSNVSDLTVNDLDYDGTGTFNFNLRADSGGDIYITGGIKDNNTASSDIGTINIETTHTDSDIILNDGATVHSHGGDITYSSMGWLGLVRTKTSGGALNISAQKDVYDNGHTGPDIETSGGLVTFNVAGNIGVIANGSIEVRDSVLSGVVAAENVTWDFRSYAGSAYIELGNIDYNNATGFNLLTTISGGDINVNGIINDSDTVTSTETATITLQTDLAGDDIVMSETSGIYSHGGSITLDSLGDIGIGYTDSAGGSIGVSVQGNIYDLHSGDDLTSGGGIITINSGGNIGGSGTGLTSPIEVFNSTLKINLTGTNQSMYFENTASSTDLTFNTIDYDSNNIFNLNAVATNGGDIIINGSITDMDSVGSTDLANIVFETTNINGNIVISDGSLLRSYGGDIHLLSQGSVGLAYTKTDGGDLFINALDVYDNGSTNPDIETNGGLATLNIAGNVGVTGGNGIDVYNTVIAGSILANNATWNIDSLFGASSVTLDELDINGAMGFSLNVNAYNGDINVAGAVSDSDLASLDSANIFLKTHTNGDNIIMNSGVSVNSYGGSIDYESAGNVGLSQTLSMGGEINITAADQIYDNNNLGSDISSSGGLVTLSAGTHIGGTSFASAIEIHDSIIDVLVTSDDQNAWFNVDEADSTLNIRNIDYNNGNGFILGARGQNGADIIVSGQLQDSDLGVNDSAYFSFVTTSSTGDITINDGATIRSGNTGSVSINSAGNLNLTGIFTGSSGAVIQADGDILDNGNTTFDINSSAGVILTSGGDVGLAGVNGALDVSGGTYDINMGQGSWSVVANGDIELRDVQVDGANGGLLSFISSGDLLLSGGVTDNNTSTIDKIDLTVGSSSPGFVILPDAGYSVAGNFILWGGTGGLKDEVDERVNITADGFISSGPSFLLNSGPIILDLSVDTIDINDGTGSHFFEINNNKDLAIADIDNDGERLKGKNFKLNIQGALIVPNDNLNDVDDQLWIIASDVDDPDADNIVTITDSNDANFNLIVDLTGQQDVIIRTNASQIDGTVVSGASLTFDAFSYISLNQDLNLDGNLLNGAGDITVISSGHILMPNAMFQTQGGLTLQGSSIDDGDQFLGLNSSYLIFDSAQSDANYRINSNASQLDIRVSGLHSNIRLTSGGDLNISDLNGDGSSLYVADGYSWIDAKGALTVNGQVTALDAANDGVVGGWLYFGYEGNASVGALSVTNISANGSIESAVNSLMPVTNAQIMFRQEGAAHVNNQLLIGGAATTINTIGGDVVLDIGAGTSNIAAAGSINLESSAVILARNTATDPVQNLTYTEYSPAATIQASIGRTVTIMGYTHSATDPSLVVDNETDQALEDAINGAVGSDDQGVAEDIQNETVAAESSPNVNVALNEMFSGCRQAENEDKRCQVKDEIERFLGRFLMGGSMPKTR